MTRTYTRRRAILTTAAVLLGGCLGRGEEDSPAEGDDDGDTPTITPTPTPDGGEMTPTDDGTPTPEDDRKPVPPGDREELADQLPTPSPMTGSLVDVVTAADRAAAADDHGLEFQPDDHSLRVAVELEAERELPDGYRVDIVDEYGGYVIAYVHVDDLVGLAIEDAVRKVQRPPESRTDDDGGFSDAAL